MAAIVSIVESGGEMAQKSSLPLWILLIGGFGIVLGLSTLGYRVIQTIVEKITELVPTRGFSAELAAAIAITTATTTTTTTAAAKEAARETAARVAAGSIAKKVL